ncbi:hypothetical protein M0805_000573 [Coniferiporia weirii]|nr:hypothetical protein M0805_000573 [Coniferiporia weirii]
MPLLFDIDGMDLGASTCGSLHSIDKESMFSFNYSSFDLGLSGITSATAPSTSPPTPANVSSSVTSGSCLLAINPQLVGKSTPPPASQHKDDSEDEMTGMKEMPKKILMTCLLCWLNGSPSMCNSLSNGERLSAGKNAKDDMDSDNWRLSAEEYQKMNSKEKCQLWNKIMHAILGCEEKSMSTLFRVMLPSTIVSSMLFVMNLGVQSPNNALCHEAATLKKAILEGCASPMLPPSSQRRRFTLFMLVRLYFHNQQQLDPLAAESLQRPLLFCVLSPLVVLEHFGDGGQTGFGRLGGGITPAHTAIIPETAFSTAMANAERENENLNPTLNQIICNGSEQSPWRWGDYAAAAE